MYFARGAQAVNPAGRQGFELEQEQRLMLENGEAGGGIEAIIGERQQPAEQEGGIFSSSTLAALKTSKVSTAPKAKAVASSGPLVAYGSDSEEDE